MRTLSVWRFIRLRASAVYAPDEEAAREDAAKEFQLNKFDERHLLIRSLILTSVYARG